MDGEGQRAAHRQGRARPSQDRRDPGEVLGRGGADRLLLHVHRGQPRADLQIQQGLFSGFSLTMLFFTR